MKTILWTFIEYILKLQLELLWRNSRTNRKKNLFDFPSFFMINKRKKFFISSNSILLCDESWLFIWNFAWMWAWRGSRGKTHFRSRKFLSRREGKKREKECQKRPNWGDVKCALCKWWKCKLLIIHDVHASPSNLAQSLRLRLTANSSTNF